MVFNKKKNEVTMRAKRIKIQTVDEKGDRKENRWLIFWGFFIIITTPSDKMGREKSIISNLAPFTVSAAKDTSHLFWTTPWTGNEQIYSFFYV